MSKIGKISISIPEKVKVALSGNNVMLRDLLVKKSLFIDIDNFDLKINDGKKYINKAKKTRSRFKKVKK